MTAEHHETEYDGTQADAKDAIDQIAAGEAGDDVGPTVQRIELSEGERVDVQVLDEVVLERGWTVGAEIVAKAEKAHEEEAKKAIVAFARVASRRPAALHFHLV